MFNFFNYSPNIKISDKKYSITKLTIESNNLKTFSDESLGYYIFLEKIDANSNDSNKM